MLLFTMRACSRRALSNPILVVSSLLLGSWNSSCWPGRTRMDMWGWCFSNQLLATPWGDPTFPEVDVALLALDLTPLQLVVLTAVVLGTLPALAFTVGADSVGWKALVTQATGSLEESPGVGPGQG